MIGFQVGNLVVEIEGAPHVRSMPGFEPSAGSVPSLRLLGVPFVAPTATRQPLLEQDGFAVFTEGDDLVFELRETTFSEAGKSVRAFALIEIAANAEVGRLSWRPDVTHDVLAYNPTSEMLTLELLSRGRGALIHGAAFAVDDRAYLLPGISGAGKTTISRALAELPGVEILSDERVVVRPVAGQAPHGWVVDGTPWPGEGEYTSRRTVPLYGVLFPDQGSEDAFVAVGAAKALGMLYRCHFRPFWRAEAQARTLDLLQRLVEEVPTALARNRLHGGAAQMLVDRLRSEPA